MLNTKDMTVGSGKVRPLMGPGNRQVRINQISFDKTPYDSDAYNVNLHMETRPVGGDFEGFFRNKDNESEGRYEGQIGRVKASQYAFADGETKSGIKIERDRSLLIWLKNFSAALGITDWFTEQDNKHETIEDFVKAFNKTAPYQNKYLYTCLAGKEYENKSGYIAYDCWFAKAQNRKYGYAVNEKREYIGLTNDEVDILVESIRFDIWEKLK